MGSNQETSGTQAGFEGFTADKLARDLMDLLERKIKKCNSHREREVLRYAQHLLQCNGCEKDRIHKNTGCINCREKKSRKWKRKSCSPAHFHCNRYFVPLFKCSDLKGKPLSIFRRKKNSCHMAIFLLSCHLEVFLMTCKMRFKFSQSTLLITSCNMWLALWPESDKAKTFQIVRFLSQKHSGWSA